MADPAVHECIAQVSTPQLCPTILSPVRCTPAAALPIHSSSLDQALSCCVVPLRMADPYGTRVHCTGLNTLTLPHDPVTCALHTRRGTTHSPLLPGSSAELLRRAASHGRSLRYTSALHRSQHSNSAPRSCHLCAAHPPRHHPFTPVTWIKRRAAASCRCKWQIPTVHECIAQVSTTQLCPTILSPVRCTPAAAPPIHSSSLDQALNCCVVPQGAGGICTAG